jgi:hypothetical protein
MASIYFRDQNNNIYITRHQAESSTAGNLEFVCGHYNFAAHQDASIETAIDYRTKEIADIHQYTQLFYSGGSDSHTILKSFVKNNIPLSEIVLSRWSTDNDFLQEQNKEINQIAVPLLNRYQEYIDRFRVKITFCDFGLDEIARVYHPDLLAILHGNGIYNPCTFNVINFAWPQLRDHHSMCQIVGWEKPLMQYKNKKFYTFMFDKAFPSLTENPEVFAMQENFYFGGDGFLTVNQFRRAAEMMDIGQVAENQLFTNSNKDYFNSVVCNLRDAQECGASNTEHMGKSFTADIPEKEKIFFSNLKKHSGVWNPITTYCESENFSDITNRCSYLSKNKLTIDALVATQQEIA